MGAFVLNRAISTRGRVKSHGIAPGIAPIFCETCKESNTGQRGLGVSLAAICNFLMRQNS